MNCKNVSRYWGKRRKRKKKRKLSQDLHFNTAVALGHKYPADSKEMNTLYFHTLATRVIVSLPQVSISIEETRGNNAINILWMTERAICCDSQSIYILGSANDISGLG